MEYMLFEIAEPNQSENPHNKKYAIGIDLGTTHSLLACFRNGVVDILPNHAQQNLIPSAVYIDVDNQIHIGTNALSYLNTHPNYVFTSFKRFMGQNVEDVQQHMLKIPYYLASGINSHSHTQSNAQQLFFKTECIRHSTTHAVELSAYILQYLYTIAQETMHGECAGAVITVPAYFNDAQRQATKNAAAMVGLNVLRLINEPTAAALAYGLNDATQGYFAVYDLGGGTFDVSILNIQDDVFEVVATAGNTILGGDDFDINLTQYIIDTLHLQNITNTDFYCIQQQAKHIKHQLTNQKTQQENLSTHIILHEQKYIFNINQFIFHNINQNLLTQTLDLLQQALQDAKIKIQDIQHLVLVGGSTRMTCVLDILKQFLPNTCNILNHLNPDEVVAIGAAHQAHALIKGTQTTQHDEWLLLDVVPLSLGIETMGGLVEKIIERNSTIPIAKAQDFTTYQDGQTAIVCHIVQGEREQIEDCRSLARFTLSGIPPMVAGMAKVRVLFSIDANGLLSVTATELSSNISTHIDVEPSYGLDEQTILNSIQQSFQYAHTDMQIRMLKEQILESEQLIYACKQALHVDAHLLTPDEVHLMHNEIQQLNIFIHAAKKLQDTTLNLNIKDINISECDAYIQLKNGIQHFTAATDFFADKRMNKAIQKAIVGQII
jgi:molecular chaperone HscA